MRLMPASAIPPRAFYNSGTLQWTASATQQVSQELASQAELIPPSSSSNAFGQVTTPLSKPCSLVT